MIDYNLAQLANSRADVTLLPISERAGTRLQYRTILRQLLRSHAIEIRNSVMPAYEAHQAFTQVTDEEAWFINYKVAAQTLVTLAIEAVQRILGLETERHTNTFRKQAARRLGVNLQAVVRNEDLEEYLRDAAARNASLIRSLNNDAIKEVEQLVFRAKIEEGKSVKQLTAEIRNRFGVLRSRAELIAFDQTSKLNSDLNRIRQTQAGVKSYEWMTSRDERVRPRHRRLHGKRYMWGQSTGAEGGLPPGQPIRCRCISRGIVPAVR